MVNRGTREYFERVSMIRKETLRILEKGSYSSSEICDLLKERGIESSPEEIGNNLKMLRRDGSAISEVERRWSIDGKNFETPDLEPPVKILISIPSWLNEKLKSAAEKQKVTKISLVIQALITFLTKK